MIKSLRELFTHLPPNGDFRHALRIFNSSMGGAQTLPSVVALAQKLGFDVALQAMRKSERGRLVADTFAESGFRIEVNERDDVCTRRWTVLHELMHGILHRREDPFAYDQYRAGGDHFYDDQEIAEEREANAFVEALVFGDGALEAARTQYREDQGMMARHFGVSRPTLLNALKKL